jgi:hypothetical protein
MTITIDLIDNGVLNLLWDMERLNLIHVNPPAEKSVAFQNTLPEGSAESPAPLTDSLLGIASSAGDISLDELRTERLSKYLK